MDIHDSFGIILASICTAVFLMMCTKKPSFNKNNERTNSCKKVTQSKSKSVSSNLPIKNKLRNSETGNPFGRQNEDVNNKDIQEDSLDQLQPRKLEAKRKEAIGDNVVKNKGDYKTWNKYLELSDFDETLALPDDQKLSSQ